MSNLLKVLEAQMFEPMSRVEKNIPAQLKNLAAGFLCNYSNEGTKIVAGLFVLISDHSSTSILQFCKTMYECLLYEEREDFILLYVAIAKKHDEDCERQLNEILMKKINTATFGLDLIKKAMKAFHVKVLL